MSNAAAVELHASGAETVTGAGAAVDATALRTAADLLLDITVKSGTADPSLLVIVETAPTSAGGWQEVGRFSKHSAAGHERMKFGRTERFIRCSWEITGTTPSFTFALGGEAHVTYAVPADLPEIAATGRALEKITAETKLACLLAASGLADGYLGECYTLPLASWGSDLRRAVAHIANYDCFAAKGLIPDKYDTNIRLRYLDAIKWLEGVRNKSIAPADIVDDTPEVIEGGPEITSDTKRGW